MDTASSIVEVLAEYRMFKKTAPQMADKQAGTAEGSKGELMIKIVAVGKIKEKALRAQIEEYEKRLRPFTKLEIIEVNDEVAPQSNSESQNKQVKEKEGERILAKIKEQEYVILLDLWGEMVDSEAFAQKAGAAPDLSDQQSDLCDRRFFGTWGKMSINAVTGNGS